MAASTGYDAFRLAKKTTDEGKGFAKVFSDFVNDMRSEPRKAALEQMLREHLTLQQNMMRFCMEFIEAMAVQVNKDQRNEASVELAQAIMEIDSRIRVLPKI